MISSLQNDKIKSVVKLRQRKYRDKSGQMIIEGSKEILMALSNGHIPLQIFVCRETADSETDAEIIDRCLSMNAQLFECSSQVFSKIAYRDNPHGILVVAQGVSKTLASFIPPDNSLIVIAESVEKPGNLGTILRSADASGADAVIVCDRCTDLNNPNVIRASIGTIFSVPVMEASTEEALEWLAHHKIQTVAASPSAETNYTEVDFSKATAIVVGTEKLGLSDRWLKSTDKLISIPMKGQADSLNVASAATILLYEAIRQRASI